MDDCHFSAYLGGIDNLFILCYSLLTKSSTLQKSLKKETPLI